MERNYTTEDENKTSRSKSSERFQVEDTEDSLLNNKYRVVSLVGKGCNASVVLVEHVDEQVIEIN